MSAKRWTVAAALSLASCVTLDGFLFNPSPVEEYRWDDDDPCDSQLIGDIARGEHERKGGPEPACHPSRVPPEDRTEGFVDAAGNEIHYVYARRPGADTTIFYSHGNRDHIGNYWDRVELMWEMGFNVMIYDYPGYGRSTGEPDEAGVYAAAEAALDVLPTMPGVDPDRVFFFGYSLGGGPTYEMALRASRDELSIRPRGVASEAIFCSVEALVQDGAYTDLSREFLSDNEFDNCAKIGGIDEDIPIMVIHGAIDDFVVPRHAQMLRDAAGREIEFHSAPDAMHSDIPVMVENDYATWLTDFFSR